MRFDGRKCKDCDPFFSWLFVGGETLVLDSSWRKFLTARMRAVLELIAEPPSSPWYKSSCSSRKVEAVVFSVGSKNRDCMVCSHVDFWNFLIIGIENIRLSHHRLPLRCCQCCCWEMYLSHVTITSSNVTVISDISWGRIRHDRLQGPGDMVTNVSCGGKRGGCMSSNSRSVSVDCW